MLVRSLVGWLVRWLVARLSLIGFGAATFGVTSISRKWYILGLRLLWNTIRKLYPGNSARPLSTPTVNRNGGYEAALLGCHYIS